MGTNFFQVLLITSGMLFLAGCGEDKDTTENQKQIIRGLKTVLVKKEERTTERKYPGVLQPSSISTKLKILFSLALAYQGQADNCCGKSGPCP